MTVTDNGSTSRIGSMQSAVRRCRLAVSRYDRVSGLLIALLILLGLTVVGMAAVWLTSQVAANTEGVKPDWVLDKGQEQPPVGPGQDIEPPPPAETDVVEDEPNEILDAVESTAATSASQVARQVSGTGVGEGGGGDGPGPRTPRRRWELRLGDGNSLESYAGQLDFFGIELGVLQPGNRIAYAANLSGPRPQTRVDLRDGEQRYRFTWTQGDLEEADRVLLGRAGIDVGNKTVYKFLPQELEQRLIAMEKRHADGRRVRATTFGIRTAAGGYEFYVLRQSYR